MLILLLFPQGEALADSPIRLTSLDFNISAPHMHATCLEALQLQPGERWARSCTCCIQSLTAQHLC